jgi:hypothetical protein
MQESAGLKKANTELQAASELTGKYQNAAAAWKKKYDHQVEKNVELQKENDAQAVSLRELSNTVELEELKSLSEAKKDPEIAKMLDTNVTKAEHHPPPEIDDVEETDVKIINEPVESAQDVEGDPSEAAAGNDEEEEEEEGEEEQPRNDS